MLRELQQVLRLIMQQPRPNPTGGLLVLLWTDRGSCVQKLNCTVAAAGPWCARIEMKALQHGINGSTLPCMGSCLEPDPEELSAFADLYGSLRLLLSFQIKDARCCTSEWQTHMETFLRSFNLANASIKIHLKFKLDEQTSQQEFRVKIKRKVALADRSSLILNVTSCTQPPQCVDSGCWCQGGHPVLGGRLPLSIPPQTMDHGLFGELSVQFVTLLSPCVLQYPNLTTKLTHIQLLVFSPSNVPVPGPFGFFQTLPAALDCQQLGLDRLHCGSFKDQQHSNGTLLTVEQESWDDPEQESGSSVSPMQQRLLLFLFLQHRDPFTSQLAEVMASEVLIEHHLEDILNNNRKAMTAALQIELMNTMKAQNKRKMNQKKLHSAAEVILNSAISIVSSSTNLDFRAACLECMQVNNTGELSASLRESLCWATSWKFVSRNTCYSAQMVEHPGSDESTGREI